MMEPVPASRPCVALLFLCLGIGLLGSGEAAAGWTDISLGEDDLFSPVPDVNAEDLGESASEKAYVDAKVAAARPLLSPAAGIDCAKAHAANTYACDVYGEHSPVCTGSQAQYVMSCGNHQPRPLYHSSKHSDGAASPKATSLLQEEESSYLSDDITLWNPDADKAIANDANNNKPEALAAAQKAQRKAEKAHQQAFSNSTNSTKGQTLQDVLTKQLEKCDHEQQKAILGCHKNVATEYKAFRKGNPSKSTKKKSAEGEQGESESIDDDVTQIQEETEQSADEQELGSASEIESLYTEAISALRREKRAQQKGLGPQGLPKVSLYDHTDDNGELPEEIFGNAGHD